MNHFQAEKVYFFRKPLIFVIFALLSLTFSWGFLSLIDVFQANQIKFSGMTDAPSVLEAVVFQALQWQVKLLLVLCSIIGGLTYARWNQNNLHSFYLQSSQSTPHWVLSKFAFAIFLMLIFSLPSLLQIFYVYVKAEQFSIRIVSALCGWLLVLAWMIAFTQFISSLLKNSAFAILLNIVVLGFSWFIGFSLTDNSWGKNWIQVLSPSYQFQQFLTVQISLASVVYFLFGIGILLLATTLVLKHRRIKL